MQIASLNGPLNGSLQMERCGYPTGPSTPPCLAVQRLQRSVPANQQYPKRSRVSCAVGCNHPVISSMVMASQRPAFSSVSGPQVIYSPAHSMVDPTAVLMLSAHILVHSVLQILPWSVKQHVSQLPIATSSWLASLPAVALSFPSHSSCARTVSSETAA